MGEGLHLPSCAFTFVLAATPAWFAAIVAYQSRRLVVREARQISERAAAEERHRYALKEVATLREVAEAKDRFLSVASHELRSPVTALRGTVELMRLDPAALADEASRQTMTARMDRQSERLVKLVRQLLDSSRLGHGEVPLELALCDLGESVEPGARDASARRAPAGSTWRATGRSSGAGTPRGSSR